MGSKIRTRTIFLVILSVFPAILLYYTSSKNNVCRNYSDYFLIHNSENCWHEPGYYAEVPQIILQRNLSLETYYTVTEDGYILKTFRILPKNEPKGIIFMDHSFVANAEMWVDKGDLSLGLYLLDRDYEVWLGNLRGSKYSNTHVKYTTKDFEYWDWSFHEQGIYDIKSQLDLVKEKTGRNDIIFINYSMAGTSAIAYASLRPEHAKKSVKAFINFGAVVHITHAKGIGVEIGNILKKMKAMDILHFLRIGWLPFGPFFRFLKFITCNAHPFKSICIWAHEPMIGFSKTEFDASTAPIVLEKFPDAGSTKSIEHYLQIYFSGGKLKLYDYGPEKNMKIYNATKPPLYPLNNIKVPILLYYGSEDYFTEEKDVAEFYSELPAEAKKLGLKRIENYNHFDLMFGKNREKDIYKHLLKTLQQIQ